MYWPLGAPRIYTAASFGPSSEGILVSEDGLDSGAPAPDPGARWPEREIEVEVQSDKAATSSDEDSSERVGNKTNGKAARQGLDADGPILSLRVSRNGLLFATITAKSLVIWQTRPTAVVAAVLRSSTSIETYGQNVALLLRPDSAIFVVQTALGFLITYSLATDNDARVYKNQILSATGGNARIQSTGRSRGFGGAQDSMLGAGEGGGVREVSIRFRMVIKVDAGISRALALDNDLVVATEKPPAVQCIRWTPDSAGNQASTELLSKMSWIPKKASISDMVHDRPMGLSTWCMSDGRAYAVQRVPTVTQDPDSPKKLFHGHCFHGPNTSDEVAIKAAINARFSIIAIGCANGSLCIYTVKDYAGSVPLSHKLRAPVSFSACGRITDLSYSMDGYCLFVGYEKGWAMWSVYGKPGGSSFVADRKVGQGHGESWLTGVTAGSWLGGGSQMLLVGRDDFRLWLLDMARSAVTGCYSSATISRSLLQTDTGLLVYRGYDLPDLTTLSTESSLWHQVQVPNIYLIDQWPIRCAVISPDGRYVAVAGRRGLAHYSVNSGRWKTFANVGMENDFSVRGGMCWHQHILIAAIEASERFELRLYSREQLLDNKLLLHTETLSSPAVLIAISGEDSLLVYTYDNILHHFTITTTAEKVNLVMVGQIAFHGIVRAPARVRAMSWILPEDQLRDGDPSQDVAVAAVLFLVDGKLVLLQPWPSETGALRYDMRILAPQVEYFVLARDQLSTNLLPLNDEPPLSPLPDAYLNGHSNGHGLRDSLWIFNGCEVRAWSDVQDVIRQAPADLGHELPDAVDIWIDFYPLSILLNKGIILGVEPELFQRTDIGFSFFRFITRTHLFLPHLLRYHLSSYDSPAALHLAHQYKTLTYFPHALEVLLHDVLDDEVDKGASEETTLLPSVLSFLSSFPQYLDILVQCTRKTEVRSWRTLFAYLPPPQELFEESLNRGLLKTAGGYLLVLHTFEELSSSSQQLLRLLSRAKQEEDWELCKELARFLTALDESGVTLREALKMIDLKRPSADTSEGSFLFEKPMLDDPKVPS